MKAFSEQALERLLEHTLKRASRLSRKVFGSRLSAHEALELIREKGDRAIIATASRRGRPHISMGSVVLHDGRLFITCRSGSRRLRNLLQNPRAAILLADGWRRQLIVEGLVERPKRELEQSVLDIEKALYGWRDDRALELIPSKAFTYKAPAEQRAA
jgi:pyridoxine/pyridoxamine 5'-phosphate oxidase